jgi:hypothetical protein
MDVVGGPPGDLGPSVADKLEEGVERTGVAGLVPALAVGGTEDLVDDRIERRVEQGAGVRRAATLDVPTTLGVGPTMQAALAVETAMGRVGVGIGGRLGPVGLLA